LIDILGFIEMYYRKSSKNKAASIVSF